MPHQHLDPHTYPCKPSRGRGDGGEGSYQNWSIDPLLQVFKSKWDAVVRVPFALPTFPDHPLMAVGPSMIVYPGHVSDNLEAFAEIALVDRRPPGLVDEPAPFGWRVQLGVGYVGRHRSNCG